MQLCERALFSEFFVIFATSSSLRKFAKSSYVTHVEENKNKNNNNKNRKKILKQKKNKCNNNTEKILKKNMKNKAITCGL